MKTHPLSPSLIKRGGTKGGEFSVIDRSAFGGKESAGFLREVEHKGSHTLV